MESQELYVPKVPGKVLQCGKCDYKTGIKNSLRKHVEVIHDKFKRFSCQQCDYKAATLQYLNRHVEVAHEKIKRFACNQCQYKAAWKHHLEQHVKVFHDGIKDFKCDKCPFRTGDKSYLRIHIKKGRHDKDFVLSFACQMCNFKASRKQELNRHNKAVHDHGQVGNLQCLKCPFVAPNNFSETFQKQVLDKHVLNIHNDSREFSCEKCNYRTSHKEALVTHMKMHNFAKSSEAEDTKGKMKKCQLCKFMTHSEENLTGHIMSTHVNK